MWFTVVEVSSFGMGLLGAGLLFTVWGVGNAPFVPMIFSSLFIGSFFASSVAFSPLGKKKYKVVS